MVGDEETVERIAKALFDAEETAIEFQEQDDAWYDRDWWSDIDDEDREKFRYLARTVLASTSA